MKKALLIFAMILVLFSFAGSIQGGSVDLKWNNPTTWSDSTVLAPADLAGNRVKYGTASGSYPNIVSLGTTTATTVTNLTNGVTYYFIVTAVSTTASKGGGSESVPSNEVSVLVPYKTPGGCSALAGTGRP